MAYNDTLQAAEAQAAKMNAKTPRSAQVVHGEANGMYKVAAYKVHAHGGREFTHFEWIEETPAEETAKPAALVLEFSPAVNAACDHSTAYVGDRPVATLQRKRATDYSTAPVWQVFDISGRRVASVRTGQRWGELLAMERAFLHAKGLRYVSDIEDSTGAQLDYDARAEFKRTQQHVMRAAETREIEAEADAIATQRNAAKRALAAMGADLDTVALGETLANIGMTVVAVDETGAHEVTPDPMESELIETREALATWKERADLAALHLVNVVASLAWHLEQGRGAGMDQHRLTEAQAFLSSIRQERVAEVHQVGAAYDQNQATWEELEAAEMRAAFIRQDQR